MGRKPTVFVVDDDPGALRSLCWLIEQADLPVRAFCSGREFLESYDADEPGCLVLDVRMPETTGLEVQKSLWDRGIRLPTIFITAHGDVPTCAQAFKAGAFDFLEKPVDDSMLLECIHRALARCEEQKWVCSTSEYSSRVSHLTSREKEVLDLLLAGKSLKEIAATKDVSVQTIWKQRANIFQKMGVENDVELVRVAMQWSQDRPW